MQRVELAHNIYGIYFFERRVADVQREGRKEKKKSSTIDIIDGNWLQPQVREKDFRLSTLRLWEM